MPPSPLARLLAVALAACGARASPAAGPGAATDRVAIIAAEPGPMGARLVAIDEHGDRQFELVQRPTRQARDTHPAVSPDGAWLVFASSRDRPLDETSLWIAAVGADAPARRLTSGAAIDAHPAWLPDGSAIVFASTRSGGDFDLWQLAIDRGQPGELRQLTDAAGHEVTPAAAAGGAILYASVIPDEARRIAASHLEERGADGAIRQLTSGPADSSPAVSPDGARLIFARPQPRANGADTELWVMTRATGAIARLVDLPLTDEGGPVWSRDGRFVFATSVLRGDADRVVFSSIIHVDTGETPPVARMLEDRVGGIARLTPAMTATPLDAAALRRDPEYLPELARVMVRAIEQQRQGPRESDGK